MMPEARYLVINCYPTGHWDHGAQIWVDALREENEEWVIADAHNLDETPPPETALQYDGIVITGSPAGVYQNLPWMDKIRDIIKAAYCPSGSTAAAGTRRSPRIVGGCFGHQILAQALGGHVEPQGFFVLKAETLRMTQAFKELPFVQTALRGRPRPRPIGACSSAGSPAAHGTGMPETSAGAASMPTLPTTSPDVEGAAEVPSEFHIIESHGDCVRTLPPDCIVLASSDTCAHEMLLMGSNCLGIQSHPEFELEREVKQRLWPRNVEQSKRIAGPEEQKAAWATFETRYSPASQAAMLSILRTFLKGQE